MIAAAATAVFFFAITVHFATLIQTCSDWLRFEGPPERIHNSIHCRECGGHVRNPHAYSVGVKVEAPGRIESQSLRQCDVSFREWLFLSVLIVDCRALADTQPISAQTAASAALALINVSDIGVDSD